MPNAFLDIAFTPSVRAAQRAMGVEGLWERSDGPDRRSRFGADEAAFIAARDSFYMATVGEDGWPYVQHRGGPPGFLRVLDETTLAFADFGGNRQYISLGHLTHDDRACLFLMDYAQRARLKIYARVAAVSIEEAGDLVLVAGYKARVERVFRLSLAGFDWNCSQHITRRFTGPEIATVVTPLQERIAALEAENTVLKARLGHGA
jgi:uncharacterized protein